MEKELQVLKQVEKAACVGGGFGFGFEWSSLWHYMTGNGDTMHLDDDRFNSIVAASESGTVSSTGRVTIDGVEYTTADVSFYSSSEYDYALGTARLYYDERGTCVGFRDYYDFDSQSGTRSDEAEEATHSGSLISGDGYWITYGVGAYDYE
jgi:hypothetical protein